MKVESFFVIGFEQLFSLEIENKGLKIKFKI